MEVAQQILALDARYNSFRISAFPQHSKRSVGHVLNQFVLYTLHLETEPAVERKCQKRFRSFNKKEVLQAEVTHIVTEI